MQYIALAAAALLIGLDQLTKWLAVTFIRPEGTIPLIKFGDTEVLNLTYMQNDGAAFSILQGKQLFLIIITSIVVLAAIIALLSKKVKSKWLIWAIALVVAGGGNLIDRVVNQYVVDFIDFRLINFAVFNVADICAVCGAIMMLIYVIADEVKAIKKKKNETAAVSVNNTDAEQDIDASHNNQNEQ